MDCSGIGFNRCKFKHGASINGGDPADPLMEFAQAHISEMEDYAENHVDSLNLSGSHTMKIARDTDGDGAPNTLVVLSAQWNAEDEDFNDGVMTLWIDEIDYPY